MLPINHRQTVGFLWYINKTGRQGITGIFFFEIALTTREPSYTPSTFILLVKYKVMFFCVQWFEVSVGFSVC
jgi:hypothetical protein